jgi:hypothetical protein
VREKERRKRERGRERERERSLRKGIYLITKSRTIPANFKN